MSKRQFAYRPERQSYKNYKGILGVVVGISKEREINNALLYEVKCADCGKIHLRNAKHLKQGIRFQDCEHYKPHNYTGIEKHDAFLRKRYGITRKQYDDLLESQGGGCAICKRKYEPDGRRLSVDHCHTTGKVRGLLCDRCNRGLGYFKEDTQALAQAIKYLTKD